MSLLVPATEITDVFFVLFLELFAIKLEIMAKVVTADGVVIQILLLKKDRIP